MAQGAPFELTFGIEEGLRVERKVVEEVARDTGLFGGKRRFRYAYRFEVANYRKSSEELEVAEHVPVSELDDVKVELDTKKTTAGYALDAYAQAKPEVLIKQRQAAMTLIGKYWGPLGGMASGKAPYNAETAARNAGFLATLSQMPWDGFHASTKDTSEKTRALPAIFENEAKFKEAADRFQNAAAKLPAAAKDEGSFKQAAGEVGKSCGGCHNEFRAK